MRWFSLWILLCVVSCSNQSALAHPRGAGAPYSVVVVNEHGRELRTFHHGGQTFVLGDYGDRYNIRIENRTARRVEAVVTVDGRDVISGQLGDYRGQRGYVLAPYGRATIEGFRQNLSQVAAFRFSAPGNSYSSRMGTPQHVGVIGVAFFPERGYHAPPPRPIPYSHRGEAHGSRGRAQPRRDHRPQPSAADSDAEASAAPESQPQAARERAKRGSASGYVRKPSTNNLGTQYGETRHSQVSETSFRRENPDRPAQLISLRYDDRDGLRARGIRLSPRRPPVVRYNPEPFPNSRFAPPPPPRY